MTRTCRKRSRCSACTPSLCDARARSAQLQPSRHCQGPFRTSAVHVVPFRWGVLTHQKQSVAVLVQWIQGKAVLQIYPLDHFVSLPFGEIFKIGIRAPPPPARPPLRTRAGGSSRWLLTCVELARVVDGDPGHGLVPCARLGDDAVRPDAPCEVEHVLHEPRVVDERRRRERGSHLRVNREGGVGGGLFWGQGLNSVGFGKHGKGSGHRFLGGRGRGVDINCSISREGRGSDIQTLGAFKN